MKVHGFLDNPGYTPIFKYLIAESARPLRAVEQAFAIDMEFREVNRGDSHQRRAFVEVIGRERLCPKFTAYQPERSPREHDDMVASEIAKEAAQQQAREMREWQERQRKEEREWQERQKAADRQWQVSQRWKDRLWGIGVAAVSALIGWWLGSQ